MSIPDLFFYSAHQLTFIYVVHQHVQHHDHEAMIVRISPALHGLLLHFELLIQSGAQCKHEFVVEFREGHVGDAGNVAANWEMDCGDGSCSRRRLALVSDEAKEELRTRC